MFPPKEKGFMTYERELPPNEPVRVRTKHWDEFARDFDDEKTRQQSYRCMNCGVPFCNSGCPLGNVIPDFNDLVKGRQMAGGVRTASFHEQFSPS